MRDPASILSSGGMLVPGAAGPTGETLDDVVARAWHHPVLGGRAVVRLIPDALGPGADAEMAALGFGPSTGSVTVGRQRRRAPGFPGWALLNDPKNARFALEVVQDMKKAARRAVSKPGHAREDLLAIGTRLARTTPHFLPSFWEETGRIFLGVGNHSYAAQSFEKAREAERQFGLPVDEQARADAFLEFALAGALAAKSLVAYAKSLSESKDKPKAYGLYYDLCVRRTLGGVPPFSGMGKELRALAKAAGLNLPTEDVRFLRDVLTSPAIGRAPNETWKLYKGAIVELVRTDPQAATRLLDLFPTPSGSDDAFQATWVGLLKEAGAFQHLLAAEKGRPAAWFRKYLAWMDEHTELVLDLLRLLAPRLIADATPISLVPPESWREEIDVRLLELALELGVPVLTPSEEETLDFEFWAKGGEEAADPVRIASDPRFEPLIARSLGSVVGDDDFELAARGKSALKAARRAWLLEHVKAVTEGGLLDARDALETLESKTGPAHYVEFPEALALLQSVDLTPMLACTLRLAVFDELGWPALEQAWKELEGTGPKKADVELAGSYPWLVLHTDRKAVVVGPDGIVFSHDLKLPKGADPVAFRYSGGQLLVVFRDDNYQGKGYWSGRPADVFDVEDHYRLGWRHQHGVLLPDGRVTEGRRVLSPGDTTLDKNDPLWGDGTDLYAVDDADEIPPAEHPRYRKVDPRNGQLGAAERPASSPNMWPAAAIAAWGRWARCRC